MLEKIGQGSFSLNSSSNHYVISIDKCITIFITIILQSQSRHIYNISLKIIGEFGIVYRGVLEEHNADETKIHAVAIKTLKGVL